VLFPFAVAFPADSFSCTRRILHRFERIDDKQTQRTVALHDAEELDDDLGGWADHDLALAGLLGVVDGVKRIVEDGGLGHFGGGRRFSNGEAV